MHFNGTTTCRDCFTVGEHPENTSCEAVQRALNYRNRTKTHKYPSSIPGCSNCGRPHPREKCQNLSLPKQQQQKKWIPVVGSGNKEVPKKNQVQPSATTTSPVQVDNQYESQSLLSTVLSRSLLPAPHTFIESPSPSLEVPVLHNHFLIVRDW